MKRILIIGPCGSGKSFFSRKLKEKLNIEVYHLDNIFWNEDKTNISNEEFDKKLLELLKKDSFIIDGNFARTLDIRLNYCDTVFYLDIPIETCLEGIKNRKGQVRSDLPWLEDEYSDGFLDYVKNFNYDVKPKMLEILSKHKDINLIVFSSRKEVDNYINSMR